MPFLQLYNLWTTPTGKLIRQQAKVTTTLKFSAELRILEICIRRLSASSKVYIRG